LSDFLIDLYRPDFWIIFGLALIGLVPCQSPTVRKCALALLNLGFLALLLKVKIVVVLAGAVGAWVCLQLLARWAVDSGPETTPGDSPRTTDNRISATQSSILNPRRSWLGPAALCLGGVVTLLLFLLHKVPVLSVELGLGRLNPILAVVSFSYLALRLVDVSRAVFERRYPPPDLVSTVNYLVPFHMLAAGPIQAYDDFVAQPATPPTLTIAEALAGAERIVLGLFKKFVVALLIEKLFLTGFRAGGAYFLLEVQLHFLWLYLDFSAYSDIAVGVGRLIGVATPENFNRPYLARNVIEFWDRWHISLSHFIRRHLFFPVQMSLLRRTQGQLPLLVGSLAFLVAFGLCGLWHEFSVRWLLWGLLQALGLIVCSLYKVALTGALGRQGVKAYLSTAWIRVLAVFLTFEFAAFSLVVVRYPYQGAF
jgi:D-alanyl-lipoteichoic acid acyltransferase DltB (MBOAT superfamily)